MKSMKNALALVVGFLVICSSMVVHAADTDLGRSVRASVAEAKRVWAEGGHQAAVLHTQRCYLSAPRGVMSWAGQHCFTLEMAFGTMDMEEGRKHGSFFMDVEQTPRISDFMTAVSQSANLQVYTAEFVKVYRPAMTGRP